MKRRLDYYEMAEVAESRAIQAQMFADELYRIRFWRAVPGCLFMLTLGVVTTLLFLIYVVPMLLAVLPKPFLG